MMDDSDVRYIVEQAVRDVRNEMQNEIDRLSGEIAKLYCQVKRLEDIAGLHV